MQISSLLAVVTCAVDVHCTGSCWNNLLFAQQGHTQKKIGISSKGRNMRKKLVFQIIFKTLIPIMCLLLGSKVNFLGGGGGGLIFRGMLMNTINELNK